MKKPRVAIVCDLANEGWRAMDLVAEMLTQHLHSEQAHRLTAIPLKPRFAQRIGALRPIGNSSFAVSTDRLLNRFHDYPQWLRCERNQFDVFHIIDHSYAHLALELPPERTVITCHDIDAFHSLLPEFSQSRSLPHRMIAKRLLSGLRRAAIVTTVSEWTREQLLLHDLVPADRVLVVRNGVHPTCCPDPDPDADAEACALLGSRNEGRVNIIHVGSNLPRKRIDLLLNVLAAIREKVRNVHLVRIGGSLTSEQTTQAKRLGIDNAITTIPFVARKVLAALYRCGHLTLVTSEREGFGLPVIESLACGTPVIATDLPVFREIGGDVVTYCGLGDIELWTRRIAELLREREVDKASWRRRVKLGLKRSSKFSWSSHADAMGSIYEQLVPEAAGIAIQGRSASFFSDGDGMLR